jgi:hypothetical protein
MIYREVTGLGDRGSTLGKGPVKKPTQPPVHLASVALEVKLPKREANLSPPSSVDVTNGGAIPLLPQYVFLVWCFIK